METIKYQITLNAGYQGATIHQIESVILHKTLAKYLFVSCKYVISIMWFIQL